MIQIAYVSSTRELLSAEDIAQILSKSRENNGRRGITGMLLYKGGNVLQVLEGEKEALAQLFQKISQDERHHRVMKLYEKAISEREFPAWSMGFHDLDAEGARHLEGYSEFMDPKFDMSSIKPTAASKLMGLFRQGMR